MQNSKKIALIIGIIGLLLCIPCFFIDPGDYTSTILGVTIVYVVLILFITTVYFLYSYFHDYKVHPEYKQEAKTMMSALLISIVVGLILSFIFGGGDPVTSGDGTIVDSKSKLIFISTIIYAALLLLLAAFVLSLKPLFNRKKSNNEIENTNTEEYAT